MGYDNPLQNEYESSRHNEGPWCDDCHGYTHMPYCPKYEESNRPQYDGIVRHVNEWRKVYHGPSRPMIETGEGNLLSVSQFERGRWNAYEREDSDIDQIVNDHNEHQQHAAQLRFLGNRAEELSSLLAGMTTERDEMREVLEKLNSTLIGLQAHPHIYERTVIDRYLHFMVTEIDTALNHTEQGERS